MTKAFDMQDLSRWDDVRVFLAALRARSFTAAATRLGTDQSTVSRRVAALETRLGVALFERGRRAVTPTEAALELRDAAERVEAEVMRFADGATELRDQAVEGRVRVATTEELAIHVLVPRVLPALRRRYPGLFVDLVTGYRAADLVGREADVAVRFFRTERGDLVARRVAEWPTAVLAARTRARRWAGRALGELDWISVELSGLATPESTWLEAATARPPVLVCSSYQVQLAAVREGLGVGVGPRFVAGLGRGLVALDVGHDLPVLEVFLVTRRAIRRVPRVVAVMDALGEALARLSGGRPATRRPAARAARRSGTRSI